LIASTSWAFFIEPAPEMPSPEAIAFRSAMSRELSPPPRLLAVPDELSGAGEEGVESMVSVT
jgi:hypothetical protein